jgi:demethylmenaquinone methyltransferase/2-methoxy-6-polyprenyl-1,4-benzoquinol methylase
MSVLDHFSMIAPCYDRIFGPGVTEQFVGMVAPDPSHRLLDVGGGTGRIARHFVDRVAQVCVLDPSSGMARQSHDKGICVTRGDCEEIPFSSGSFDRIIVIDAFHHFRDQKAAVGELARVLAPRGRLIIKEPDIAQLGIKVVAWAEKLLLMRSHFRDVDAIRRLLSAEGLRSCVDRRDHMLWMVAGRKV